MKLLENLKRYFSAFFGIIELLDEDCDVDPIPRIFWRQMNKDQFFNLIALNFCSSAAIFFSYSISASIKSSRKLKDSLLP